MTNEELQARVDALTAQNAELRAALKAFANEENWAPSEEEPGFWIFGNDEGIPIHDAPCDKVKLVLAETPDESLEAVRAAAKSEARKELAEITAKLFPELQEAIRSAVWSETETIQGAMSKALDNIREKAGRELIIAINVEREERDRWRELAQKYAADAKRMVDLCTEAVEQRDELQQALESDRINVIEGVNRLTKEIESRAWLSTGARSSYEWDDARYQQEFRDAAEAIVQALEPLKKIGADLSNCPADAKRSLEQMRAKARLQTLKDIASLVPGIDEGPLDKGSILTRLSGWLDEAGKADLEVIRAEAGRERAVRELAELANKCRHVAHLPNMGHEAVIPTRFLRERLEEIAREAK